MSDNAICNEIKVALGYKIEHLFEAQISFDVFDGLDPINRYDTFTNIQI